MEKQRDISKNNFYVLLTEEAFFSASFTFIDAASIVPVFVYMITGSVILSGLSTALKTVFFILPQLFMGFYNRRINNLPSFMRRASLTFRLPFFIFSILYFLDIIPSAGVLILFFISFILLNSADGIINVAWLDVFGRTIPDNKKSIFFGLMLSIGGFVGLVSSFAIKHILELESSLDIRYSMIFFIGSILILLSSFSYFYLKDSKRSVEKGRINILESFRLLPQYFKTNMNFSRFIIIQALYYFNNLALPLYIVFAQNNFKLTDEIVSGLIYIQITGIIAGGFFWAVLSKLMGNKNTIRIAFLLNIAVPLSACIAFSWSVPSHILLSAVVFGAGILCGGWLGFTNYLLEITGEDDRAIYLGITSTIALPLSLTSFLGGVLATGIGYIPVFILVILIMLTAFLLSLRL